MNRWVLLTVLFPAIAAAGLPRHKQAIEQAPPPAEILQAKAVYLRNAQESSLYLTKGGNELAFNALYTDMKEWGRFALVDSPGKADLVISLGYGGSRSQGNTAVYNSYSHSVQSFSRVEAQFILTVSEARSGRELWSESDQCGTAYRVKNQRKEVVKSVGRLVDRLKQMGR